MTSTDVVNDFSNLNFMLLVCKVISSCLNFQGASLPPEGIVHFVGRDELIDAVLNGEVCYKFPSFVSV